MRAGLLRERILFQKKEVTQSKSGAEVVSYSTILSTKCHKLKESNIGSEVNAEEEFYGTSVRIQVRSNPVLVEATQAIFRGNRYRIVLQDNIIQDRSIIITLRKDNE